MSTKLSDGEINAIALAVARKDENRELYLPALLDHITALEAELKAAQGGLEYVKGMNHHLSNNDAARAIEHFRTKLVEAVRAKAQTEHERGVNFLLERDVIQLIQTFELER